MASTTTRARIDLRDALATPDAFPEPRPRRVDVRETHASWVFLGSDAAFKVKKPVDFGFLDFRTIEKRRAACEAEVALNKRLAPQVYRGIVPVCRHEDGTLTFGGDAEVVDWAVAMRRMADDARADVRLASGRFEDACVDVIADRLVDFHARARCDGTTAAFGTPEAIGRNVVENFAQTREVVGRCITEAEAREIEEWHTSFLRENVRLFEARIRERRIRDGHGDLRLEHVYLGDRGGLTIIDCIEFNERFRYADVCADIAFLSMDLAWNGRVDLAERFLARYAMISGDYDLYALVDFYESYRAYVRGKVATLMARDPESPADLRAHAQSDARRYFLLALAARRKPLLRPALVCVGGLIASGKSTVASAIGLEMSAPVVEADRTRKQMLGIDPRMHVHDAAWSNAYDPAFTEEVYAEVFRRARVVLDSGRPVVVDASFRSTRERSAAREIAKAAGVQVHFVECRASDDVSRARLAAREIESGTSDGRLEIFDDFRARFEPMDEMPHRLVVDTSRALAQTLADVRAQVRTWPRGFVT